MSFRRFSRVDGWLYRTMSSRLRARPLDPVMILATEIGTKSGVWLVISALAAAFCGRRGRRVGVVTLCSTLSAQAIVNVGLKPLVRRERPYRRGRRWSSLLVEPPRAHSWPSGHSASSTAAATILVAAYPERALPILMLALMVSYSRVYVGVHYPFDVAAGAGVGLAVGTVWLLIARIDTAPPTTAES